MFPVNVNVDDVNIDDEEEDIASTIFSLIETKDEFDGEARMLFLKYQFPPLLII